MIYSPASQMKGRRARQVLVVKFSMNETQMTMHLERDNYCKKEADNSFKDNERYNYCKIVIYNLSKDKFRSNAVSNKSILLKYKIGR